MAVSLTLVRRGYVKGGGVWLFAVPDGDPEGTGLPVMLSTEVDHTILMGRVDPLARRADFWRVEWPVEWCAIVDSAPLRDLADHWHLCIRGEHWVSYSYSNEESLNLFKLAARDVVDGVKPTEVSVVTPAAGGGLIEGAYKTNDHFMVRRKNGVAVGVWEPPVTMKMVVIDSSLTYRAETELVGSFPLRGIANGSSAVGVRPNEVHVLASTDLSRMRPGSIRYLKYHVTSSDEWVDETEFLRIYERGYNCQMATVVILPNRCTIITFKRFFERGTATEPDGGSIVRHVYTPRGFFYSEETLLDPATLGRYGNRPHTTAYQAAGVRYLITTWDEADATGITLGAYMRVDRIDW